MGDLGSVVVESFDQVCVDERGAVRTSATRCGPLIALQRPWAVLEPELTAASVSCAEQLETALLHAPTSLPRVRGVGVPVGRVWNIPARPTGFVGREQLLAQLGSALGSASRAVVQAVHGMGGGGRDP